MSEEKPLVDKNYLLEKYPGKGGWTYAAIPEVVQNKTNPFGWVIVKGSVDGYELNNYKLMPMGNGKLFLPVKAAIRKKIKKEAGDTVHIILYADEDPMKIPDELMECFQTESPKIFDAFMNLTEGERKGFIDWIYEAKKDETKISRIAEMMNRLEKR